MKRNSLDTGISTYPNLSKIFPIFFWKKCSKCKMEFRREWGWIAITPPFYKGAGTWRYLCNRCAPTKKEASDYFQYSKWRPSRPSRPDPQGGSGLKK